ALGVEAAELLPGTLSAFTSRQRGARLLAHAAPSVVAASLDDVLALVRGTQLKLGELVAIILAGADELLARDADGVDALLAEVPEGALRVATTATESEAIASFAERQLRRARREVMPGGAPVTGAVHGLTVGTGGRGAALRALLDAFDPPSAAIVVANDDEAREVRGALAPVGLAGVEPLAAVVTAAQVPDAVALLVCWHLPADAATLATLLATQPVRAVVLHEASERARLAALAGGAVLPLDFPTPLDALRRRDALLRAELERELAGGAPLREAQVIAPLLAQHDGISIAGAALRLLERERRESAARRAAAAVPVAPAATAPAEERARGGFGDRGDRGTRPPRGKFGDRDAKGTRPPRGKFGDRDAKGPRGGKFGDRDAKGPRGGKFGDRDDRGTRPPRGKFGDRDAGPRGKAGPRDTRFREGDGPRGPRGGSRGPRGPEEGGDRGEWAARGEALRRAKRPPRED
ncbi:MAG: hypothetical protein HY275_10525, partial [Gemmatimonadetes bacterium]|nr:hypothetical protein [Gemmatimonadota bacterium]